MALRRSWLCQQLLATEAAIDRFRTWLAGGGLERPAPNVRERLRYFGDEEMFPALVSAIDAMAPPAREWMLDRAVVFGCGWSSAGWAGGAASDLATRRVVLVSGHHRHEEALRGITWHEAGHCWLESPERVITPHESQNFNRLHAATIAHPDFQRLATQQKRQVEHRANCLAAVWAAGYQQENDR